MRKFLTLKHWQLFLLLIGIPMAFQIVSMGFVISSKDPTVAFISFPVLMFIYSGLFFSWFYSLGVNLAKLLPATSGMNVRRFKWFLFIPAVYILLIPVLLFGSFSVGETVGRGALGIFLFIFPMHLFCMFCLFYCLYFNAKALKTVEWQRPVTFEDYAGEFFLLWFFPIGIWILQPRINRLFEQVPEE